MGAGPDPEIPAVRGKAFHNAPCVVELTGERGRRSDMGRVAFIIAKQGFRDEEYAVPRDRLESAGHSVVTASTATGPATGKLGMEVQVDLALPDLDVHDYVAVVCIGGPGSPQFWDDHLVHDIVREALREGLVVAGICSAAVTLAKAGVLAGRRATVWPGDGEIFAPLVGTYTASECEVDGRCITANGPNAAAAFGASLVAALA